MQGSVKCSVSVFGVVWDGLIIVVVVIIAEVVTPNLSNIRYPVFPIVKYRHPSSTSILPSYSSVPNILQIGRKNHQATGATGRSQLCEDRGLTLPF